jgi:hypothetical protein
MEGRVTSIIAAGRTESGRGASCLGPESESASGRSAVTKADEGVTPSSRGAAHVATAGTTGVAELTHDLVRGQLSDYLDDTIGETARRRVDGHLSTCQSCTAYLNTLRATVDALGQLPAPKAPTGARARIVEQARREHG